jgi:hypothetical protein
MLKVDALFPPDTVPSGAAAAAGFQPGGRCASLPDIDFIAFIPLTILIYNKACALKAIDD